MTERGGLLTEFMSRTNPDKGNFVQRNRIVAGMCDACIVVESNAKGGSLITASLANDYNRDVFAFPGRTTDQSSRGCNALIRDNKAHLIESAEDLAEIMGWSRRSKQPVQTALFVDLTDEEQRVADALRGSDGMQIGMLSVRASLPVSRLSAILFELEMKGAVKALVGAKYKLIEK